MFFFFLPLQIEWDDFKNKKSSLLICFPSARNILDAQLMCTK